jgi:hypothetical protein
MNTKTSFKKLIAALMILSFPYLLHAQVAIEWQKCLGGSNNDWANSIQQTTDGGYVVAGYTISNNGDVSGNHGDDDYWIVKLDGTGNIQWQKCLGGTIAEYANSIQQTIDGGYVLAGLTTSYNGDVSGNHGGGDAWIVKLDGAGNIQWQKCLGGTGTDEANSIKQTADGGYVVAGSSNSNDGDVAGNNGLYDYWIVKLDGSGSIQWQKCLGGSSNDHAYSIQQTTDGGYIVAGGASSSDGDVANNFGWSDYWVVKLDAAGNIQWQKCLGGTHIDVAKSIQQTTDGGYVIAGYTRSNDGNVSGNHGAIDYWIVKLDVSGNLQWDKCLGGTGDDYSHTIWQTADGGYVVAGESNSSDGDVSGNHGASDFWIVKLSGAGNTLWQKSIGGTNQDRARCIQQTADGGYTVVGYTDSNDGDVWGNHGDADFWAVKLTEHYNIITGKLFLDLNSNNIQDAGEAALPNRQVTEITTGRTGFSIQNGTYYIVVSDTGNFISAATAINHFSTSPVQHTSNFSNMFQTDSLNDFAFQPAGLFNDLCITLTPTGNFRAGMDAQYLINYSNVGNTIINNCSVIFFPDSSITYVSSNTTPFSVTADSVVWNIGTLAPFQTGSILVTVNVNVGTPIGTIINSGVRIEPVAGDDNPTCNVFYQEVTTTGAVDPNDILVNRSTLFTTEFPNPPYLDYIIRFQNTGNDTAFTVKIYNRIDTLKLQLNTLEFMASSHPMNIMYNYAMGRMEFRFDNILLPNSNVNEPLSHGFVRYRIKPKSNLVLNDIINNSAGIYFDFAFPVLTNTATTTVILPVGIAAPQQALQPLMVYPNPANSTLSILTGLTANSKATVKIYDVIGQVVLEKEIQTTQQGSATINVGTLSNGLYILKLESTDGIRQARFVKQ